MLRLLGKRPVVARGVSGGTRNPNDIPIIPAAHAQGHHSIFIGFIPIRSKTRIAAWAAWKRLNSGSQPRDSRFPSPDYKVPDVKNLTSRLGFFAFENSLALVSGVWDSS